MKNELNSYEFCSKNCSELRSDQQLVKCYQLSSERSVYDGRVLNIKQCGTHKCWTPYTYKIFHDSNLVFHILYFYICMYLSFSIPLLTTDCFLQNILFSHFFYSFSVTVFHIQIFLLLRNLSVSFIFGKSTQNFFFLYILSAYFKRTQV